MDLTLPPIYRCIVADPPWKYEDWRKGSDNCKHSDKSWNVDRPIPYPVMSVGDIKSLPVASVTADDCDLYLWTTQRYLPDAFGVLEAWGFRYRQALTWCKTPMGTGQGGLFCPTTEFVLLGRKGRMPAGKTRIDSTWWHIPRTWKHSRKPDAIQDIIELVSDGPRLELFARRRRPGWDAWGNEVDPSPERCGPRIKGDTGQPSFFDMEGFQ